MLKISFQPKQITKKVLISLDKKPQNIIKQRFGLDPNYSSPRTLEAIGKDYGITRERVRQIEECALNRLRQNDAFADLKNYFDELKNGIDEWGGVVHESSFLDVVSKDEQTKRHFRFLFVLGEDFNYLKEDHEFHHRWTVNSEKAEKVHNALRRLHSSVSTSDVFSEEEIFAVFGGHIKDSLGEEAGEEMIRFFLRLSRLIGENALGEWGLISSSNIRPRGVRDLAYLILRKHGSPMHFVETAKSIQETFVRPINVQTVHNELIKDERFVLVGRGLYALKEWGYAAGVVRDVIKKVLSDSGPLPKNDVVRAVMKERYVKENTILINLQDNKHFKKNSDGTFLAL